MRDESGKETFWSQTFWGAGSSGRVRNPTNGKKNHALDRRRNSQVAVKRFRRSTSRTTLHEAKSVKMIFEENRTDLNHQTQWRITVKPETISGRSKRITLIVITLNQVLNCAHGRIIPNRGQENKYYLGCVAEQPYRRLLERWWRPGTVWTLDWLHAIHYIERKTSRWAHMVRESGWQEFKQHEGLIIYRQKFG